MRPTPYPEVNALLHALLEGVRPILGNQFVGMYLFGSLTSGDFDQESDVDVLVVTEEELSPDRVPSLETMHERLSATHSLWGTQLEISYIPRRALRRYDPRDALHLHLDRGVGEQLHWMEHGSSWVVQRYVLRERGITVAGPPPSSLIDPVPPEALRAAMKALLQEWIPPLLQEPALITMWGYQSYLVLSLCRILYTLREGTVVSKPVAARWAQQTLDARWAPLIERAWLARRHPDVKPLPEVLDQTCAFMRYALQTS